MKKITAAIVIMAMTALASTAELIQVHSDGNDQQWSGDGTSPANVSATTLRVGSQVANYVTGAVLPFLLPDLSGASITNVTLDFTVTGSNIGNLDAPYNAYLDLVAPHAGAVASSVTAASDISGTVLVDNYIKLTVANFPANSTYSYTVSGGTLTSYLQGIYANDPSAAGKYVMLTLVSDTPIRGGRYFTMASGDATSQQPTLNLFTAVIPEPATVGMLGLGALVALLIRHFKNR